MYGAVPCRLSMGLGVWGTIMQALQQTQYPLQYLAGSLRNPKFAAVLHGAHPPPKPVWHAPNPADRVVHIPLVYGSPFVHVHCPYIDRDRGAWANLRKKGLVNEPPSFPLQKPRQCLLWKEHLLLVWRQLMAFPVHTIIISCFCATATHANVDALYSWLAGPLCFFKRKHACEWTAMVFIFISYRVQHSWISVVSVNRNLQRYHWF